MMITNEQYFCASSSTPTLLPKLVFGERWIYSNNLQIKVSSLTPGILSATLRGKQTSQFGKPYSKSLPLRRMYSTRQTSSSSVFYKPISFRNAT